MSRARGFRRTVAERCADWGLSGWFVLAVAFLYGPIIAAIVFCIVWYIWTQLDI